MHRQIAHCHFNPSRLLSICACLKLCHGTAAHQTVIRLYIDTCAVQNYEREEKVADDASRKLRHQELEMAEMAAQVCTQHSASHTPLSPHLLHTFASACSSHCQCWHAVVLLQSLSLYAYALSAVVLKHGTQKSRQTFLHMQQNIHCKSPILLLNMYLQDKL